MLQQDHPDRNDVPKAGEIDTPLARMASDVANHVANDVGNDRVVVGATPEPVLDRDDEQNSPTTLSEQGDDAIMKRLSEYVGTARVNASINNTAIEAAQALTRDMMDVAMLSEDELADREDLNSPLAIQARERARTQRNLREASERLQDELQEQKRMEEHRAKWDAELHKYGDEELSGAEIMERIEWFSKKENQEKVRKDLIKKGKSEKEADEIIAKMKERDELMKRQRDGNPPLTPEDKIRLNMLNKDEGVKLGGAIVAEVSKQDKVVDVAADSPKNMSAEENKDETIRMRQSMAAKKNEASVPVPAKEQDEQISSSAKAYEYFSSARPMGKDFRAVSEPSNSQGNDLELTKPKTQVAYAPKLQADAALM